jgi:hypothetical protein
MKQRSVKRLWVVNPNLTTTQSIEILMRVGYVKLNLEFGKSFLNWIQVIMVGLQRSEKVTEHQSC